MHPSIRAPFRSTSAAAAAAAATVAALLAFAPSANADATCTKIAAPGGSDSAAGTLAAPYGTAQKLVDSLGPGDTGCLRAGQYNERVKVSQGGTSNARVTLTSYPGERAKIVGRFWIASGADFVTVANLDLDGTNDKIEPSPTVNANDTAWIGNDVTNDNTAICFLIGNNWGSAARTLIQHNRIHNCGKLPAANHDHGVYVEAATDTQILDNLIYDNADRGVQLYPDAQRTHVAGNVIDGNGEGIIFSGAGGTSSNDNVVEDNLLTNSTQRNNVESFYPAGTPIGTGNIVRDNCIAGGVRDNGNGGIAESRDGFTIGSGNVLSQGPGFVNRAAKDFRLQPSSPCAGIANGATGSDAARVNGAPPAPTPAQPTDSLQQNAPATQAGPEIAFSTRSTGNGRLRLKGRVRHRRHGLHAASAPVHTVVIQIRWVRAWYPVRSLRLRGTRFAGNLRLPATMRGHVLKLRAVVPHFGTSHSVLVRAR